MWDLDECIIYDHMETGVNMALKIWSISEREVKRGWKRDKSGELGYWESDSCLERSRGEGESGRVSGV